MRVLHVDDIEDGNHDTAGHGVEFSVAEFSGSDTTVITISVFFDGRGICHGSERLISFDVPTAKKSVTNMVLGEGLRTICTGQISTMAVLTCDEKEQAQTRLRRRVLKRRSQLGHRRTWR
jgi:hypothetical protein